MCSQGEEALFQEKGSAEIHYHCFCSNEADFLKHNAANKMVQVIAWRAGIQNSGRVFKPGRQHAHRQKQRSVPTPEHSLRLSHS